MRRFHISSQAPKMVCLLAIVLSAVLAQPTARLDWCLGDQSHEIEEHVMAPIDGGWRLRLTKEAIKLKKAVSLTILPSIGQARQGEAGYWFSPYGYYGEWDRSNGRFEAVGERMNMPMYGWATPRGAWLAIVTSLPYYGSEVVTVTNGLYQVGYRLGSELCGAPYEGLIIDFRSFPAGTGYAELCSFYRKYQLDRGAVKTLRERASVNPILKTAVASPEIRIRQAWKPVPSPEPWQQPENEPEVKAKITFARVCDIVRSLQRVGVSHAEICLVGWNIGGHDGRWPQYFPAESKLGGDIGLRRTIACARDAGYLIVPHGNFIEGYAIADGWDLELTAKDVDGNTPRLAGSTCWGGGQPILLCPQRAYEKVCAKVMPRLSAFGFQGLAYFDVVSILRGTICHDRRHPCNWKEAAEWWGRCAQLSCFHMGGFASEGAVDHFAGNLDSVLYASFDSPLTIEREWREGTSLAKGHRPIFQLVYHGIILSNPFTFTVNFTAQDPYARLKLLEYGGRPNFYFNSKFMTDPGRDWMGSHDLSADTDDQLEWSVAKIKEGSDIYGKFCHLQYEQMTDHREIAPNVFRTSFSNGASIVCDYNTLRFKEGD